MSSPREYQEKRMCNAVIDYHNGQEQVMEEVYPELMPFCLRVAAKTCDRYITEEDEESSIARLAILETFSKYSPERGAFYPFLGRVVRNRIIDYKRREKKMTIIPFSHLSSQKDINGLVDDSFFDHIIEDLDRKKEIEEFKALLAEFNISFMELAKTSPRQAAAREKARRVVEIISADPELTRQVLEKKLLPAKALQDKYNISSKLLDRYRKYIIAGVIILTCGYSSLAPYVTPSGGRQDG